MVTVVFEQDEECLRETEEEHRVDDAESKNIVEQHLGNHDDEWTGEAERHGEEQHVAPTEQRGEGQDQRFVFDGEQPESSSEENAHAEGKRENVFQEDRTLTKIEPCDVEKNVQTTHAGPKIIANADAEHFSELASRFPKCTSDDDQMTSEADRLVIHSKLDGNSLNFTVFIDLKEKFRSISKMNERTNGVEIHLFENGRGQERDHVQKCVEKSLP